MKKSLLVMFSVTLFFMFSMNAIAQQGKTVKVANNQELIEAYNNPAVATMELAGGYYDFLVLNAVDGTILVKGQNNGNGQRVDCDYFINPSNVCFTANPTANTAEAGTVGTECPPANSGSWSVVAKPIGSTVNFLDALNEYVMDFNVDMAGTYTLKYQWTPTTNVQTDYLFYPEPVVTLSSDSPVCEVSGTFGAEITWGYTVGSDPAPDISVVWKLDGSTIVGGGATPGTWTLTVPSCGSYELSVEVTNGACDPEIKTITVVFRDTPVVNAGTADETCGLTYSLTPSSNADCWATGSPTTSWAKFSGPGTATFKGNNVTVSECGSYVFELTVNNGACSNTDQVQIDFYSAPVVDAGTVPDVCGLSTTLDPDYTVDCANGTPTTAWSKVSGPGTVTFTGNDVSVTECGTYVFRYTVTNDPCAAVYDDVEVEFYDEATFDPSGIPTAVCGYSSGVFNLEYTVDCANSGTPSGIWSYTGPSGATATITPVIGGGAWNITVTSCGTYTFKYTVTNGPCENYYEFDITFHETPVPTISGDLDVFACETVTYEALDGRTCDITSLTYLWEVWNGTINGSSTSSTVSVTWDDDITTQGSIKVVVTAAGVADCNGEDSTGTTEAYPTLEGQVKYWNQFETYMPTPFPTSINGTYPEDYFYVELYEGTTLIGDEQIVMINIEEGLQSWFGYTLPVNEYGCDAEFNLKVWDGGYLFDPNFPGNGFNEYLGASYTYNNWGGVNATDALAIQLMATNIDINGAPYNFAWVGTPSLTPKYGYYSFAIGDVNVSSTITALDALTANYRVVDLLAKYPDAGPNQYAPNFAVTGRMVSTLPQATWSAYFDETNVPDVEFTHSGADYQYYDDAVDHKYTSENLPWEADNNYINLYYEATGDINASYVPTAGGWKVAPNMSLVYENQIVAGIDDVVTIPVTLDNETEVGAMTLNMTYNNELIEVLGVNYEEDFYNINHENGTVSISWFNTEAVNFKTTAPVAILKVKVLGDITAGTRLFELAENTELADASAQVIEGVNFKSLSLTTDASALISMDLSAKNYPNPFNNVTNISYVLPEAGQVQVVVYNKLGQVVETIVDQTQEAGVQTVEFNRADVQEGVYFYRITLKGVNNDYSVTNNMIVMD